MTKHDFHHFQVRHFNNVFEQSWCHCRVGATPAMRSNCLQTRRIHHQVKYWRLKANTCIVAAILFSGHPYIGRHQGGTTSLRYVTRKRINNEHSDRARDTSMHVECMEDFEQIVIGL